MGHKVNPHGIRLGITTDWSAKWYTEFRDYAKKLHPTLVSRGYLKEVLKPAGLSNILIEYTSERLSQRAKIDAYVARPGMVIGKKGGFSERIKKRLEEIMNMPVNFSIQEVRKPELDAKLVAENIANQLMRRIASKRAVKRAVGTAMRMGSKGIKIKVAGRLGGAEIARSETYQEGSMPLHTFRVHINYDTAIARMPYGDIGIKVWINKGEGFNKRKENEGANENRFSDKSRSERFINRPSKAKEYKKSPAPSSRDS